MNLLFCFTSILLYFISPVQYNYSFNVVVTILFLVNSLIFLFQKSKDGFLNFYSFFYFSFFLVNFIYPVFIYKLNPEYFLTFTLGFNEDYINKGTALAFFVSTFFILGANIKLKINKKSQAGYYSHKNLLILTSLFIGVFLFTVGGSFLGGNFTGASSLSLYILQILVCFLVILSLVFFRGFDNQKWKYGYWGIVGLFIAVFLYVGDRGPALSLIIMIVFLYSYYVKQLKIIYVLPNLILGLIVMSLIGGGRSVEKIDDGKNILTRGLDNIFNNGEFYYTLTLDFSVNSYTLYRGLEYASQNGLNYGATMLKDIVAVFPFFQSYLESNLDIKLLSSSEFFTKEVLGKDATWGVGTNLVADVYICYGVLGCSIIFFIFGVFIENIRRIFYLTNSIQFGIVYLSLISYSIYLPRAGIFMVLKVIIWSLIIYYILRQIGLIKYRTN